MSGTVIVGGGLAGGSAAIRLARAGHRVTLLEREREPHHKVCGEFLSVEARGPLVEVGIDPLALGGVPIDRVRLRSGKRTVAARLPFVALGLTRRRLDAALLDHAAASGVEVRRGVTVRRIDGTALDTSDGDLAPDTLLLASGKHEVRGVARDTAAADTGFVGFKTYLRLPPATLAVLDGAIEVTLFDGGYAGLQRVEGGVANLCLLVRRDRLRDVGGDWPGLRAALAHEPGLARVLGEGEEMLSRPLAIAAVPYGFLHRADGSPVFRLGDQAAVIPSFCGDGMAIALHSARLAATMIGAGAEAYHVRLRAGLAGQIGRAMALQRLGDRTMLRTAAVAALGFAPAILTRLAAATRVPEAALRAA